MNEHELSKLLHEAVEDVGVSSTAPRRVLRRTRMRLATTSALVLSSIALVAGGGFALATGDTVTTSPPSSSQPGPVITPGPQERFNSFTGEDEVILAEEVTDESTWAYTVEERGRQLCLNSKTYTETETTQGGVTHFDFGAESSIGDCVPPGVPDSSDLGFYMWDAPKDERLEVLGQVSPDVARLELLETNDSDGVVTIIQAPAELGNERNFFFLWLPLHEVGTLVAYDDAGNILLQEPLCLKAYEPHGSACTVGDRRSVSGSGRAELSADISRMACNEISRGRVGRLFGESTPEQALQRWIDDLDLDLTPGDFEIERVGSDTAVMNLRTPGGDSSVSAILSKKGDHQWSIVELFYCGGILDPPTDPPRLPKNLRQPPPVPPGSPPPSPSP